MKFLIVATLLAGCVFQLTHGDPFPEGEHVCNITEPIKKYVTVDIPVRYNIQVQDMCGILPCMKTRTETKMDQVIKTSVSYVQKPTCCPGYAQTPDNKCAPVCLSSCNNGKCIAPGQCKCQPEPTEASPGFVGPTCRRFTCLSANRWGSKCDRECSCPMNAYCSASTGKCLCHIGWKGENCTQECGAFDTDSSCTDNFELPPIIEPELNLISRESSAVSGRLVAGPESLIVEKEVPLELDPPRNDMLYLLVALSSVSLLLWLMLAVYIVRKRGNNKSDPYYSTCSSRGPGEDSNYSTSSYYSNATLRSQASPDFLSKNLSFASTTRNILLGIDTSKSQSQQEEDQQRRKVALAPKLESSLIESQKASIQNIYSEPVSNHLGDKSDYASPRSPGDMSHISLNISGSSNCDDEHIYQVPRSPMANTSLEADQLTRDEDNIYEEIKPKTPKRV